MPKPPKPTEVALKKIQNQMLGIMSKVNTSALTSSNVTSACTTSLNSYDSPTKSEMDAAHALLATPTEVETACDASLVTYDAPTKAELDTSESNIRGADSDTLKILSDQIDGIGGAGASAASHIILSGDCDAGMGASTTIIVSDDLAGFGNDYFNTKYYMQVVLNANSVGNAPENQTRQITDYVSATGTFTTNAFSANVEENDKILIVHESVALMALHADASLAKVVDDSWLAHLMAIDGNVSSFDDNTDSLEAVSNKITALNNISTAQVNTETDNALNTAVPTTPTAKSLNDILSKADGGNTYDNTTDSLEAISEAIAGVGGSVVSTVSCTTTGVIVEDSTSGTPNVVTLTPHANPNTFGTWTQLDASTSAISYITSIIVFPLSTTSTALYCIAIGTGASPATKVRFSFKTSKISGAGYVVPFTYTLPIPIKVASGVKISGKFSTDAGGDACAISIQYYQSLET